MQCDKHPTYVSIADDLRFSVSPKYGGPAEQRATVRKMEENMTDWHRVAQILASVLEEASVEDEMTSEEWVEWAVEKEDWESVVTEVIHP